ncbi:nucleotide exchange factor GrpE [Anaerosinus sp.]|uniref:nucleotide exchange factor GrpE n=1 Tax=Selenobaculum sp. TaxID=3074374 RepID=UPI003AB3C704
MAEEIKNPVDENLAKKAEVNESTEQIQPEETEQNAEVTRLKQELDVKDKLVQESADRLKRMQADFDNFRRRTRQEKEELSAIVSQNLIKELLPLLDNFERALAVESADGENFKAGVDMILKQFIATLEKNGLEPIKAVGEKFDPNFHEAIMRIADETKEDDTIAEELQRGYSVRGRVIRPSMVKVIGN